MKLMRWAICVAAFAFAGEVAKSEDYVDISAMQAKLAAQEARLNDLQAKIYGAGDACGEPEKVVADGLTSLRKNATVTIGGLVNTRYDYYDGKIESRYNGVDEDDVPVDLGKRRKIDDSRHGALSIADAKLEGKIDVNEYFDAYFKFDLHDGGRNTTSMAQNYWVRWKNICNSGFGVLVGRDSVKFAGLQEYGRYDDWANGIDDMSSNVWQNAWFNSDSDIHSLGDLNTVNLTGMAITSGMPTRAAVGADSRTVQVTPYWENKDGSFKAEVSFFQGIEYKNGSPDSILEYERNEDGVKRYRRMNDGVGSMSARLTWQPVEGLTLQGSVMRLYARNYGGVIWNYADGNGWSDSLHGIETSKNNIATNFAFTYRPAFFNKLNLFAGWTHSWNDGWVKDQDSDSVVFGFGFDITDSLTFYAKGEHVRSKSDQARKLARLGNDANFHKASGWANELGLTYTFPYGVTIDTGWRHETMNYKNTRGEKHTKLSADAFWATLGFSF